MSKSKHVVETFLMLGTQLGPKDHQRLLEAYVERVAPERAGTFDQIGDVLTQLVPEVEPGYKAGVAGCVAQALRQFTQSQFDLDLRITGTDYGPFEQRTDPYRIDRTFFHLGFSILTAKVEMEFPGYSPYSASRQLDIPIFREHFEAISDILPDYLWWEVHDRKDTIIEALDLHSLSQKRRAIADAGFDVSTFGLYLVTFQTLHV